MKIAALSDVQFQSTLTNFSGKIENYAPALGVTPDEILSVKADSTFFTYVMDVQNRIQKHSKEWTSYKRLLRSSAKTVNLGDVPVWNAVPAPPTVKADITGRFAKLVQRIQGSDNYTEAIGSDLGINTISAVTTPAELAAMKPVLKIHLVAGQPIIEWKKGDADGIEIHKAIGTGEYQYLATDLRPHFQDKSPIPAHGESAVWKYKAIYISGDDRVGQWSDEVSISVMGS